ncbi:putative RING-H2 finger protein ATL69 [Phragmites australis]|uniref:putative RING-H2 finger protein ATL69 n=1 Tax=Phragmites australis TaxID=29695 RepID=UPI002D78C581|nr:putative RING-H2 finger protein ATL69 [Phragmites australis]
MLGSGLNLVSAALGFGMTAAFVAFVCARFICCRGRHADARASPPPSSPSEFPADLDLPIEHVRCGLEPLVVAAIPTMKYNCEAFHSKDDAQCSICLGEYKEKEILRIIPTCRHNFHLACLDVWLQKQTTCPICRISLKELQAAVSSSRSIQQLPTVPENSVNTTHQWLLPVHHDHRSEDNSPETQESVEVVIEIRQ